MAKRRVGLIGGASWALATAVTCLVVWRAVAVLDDGTRTEVLSGAQVSGLLNSASATPGMPTASPTSVTSTPASTESATSSGTTGASGSATEADDPQTTPRTQSPALTPVVRTWTVEGGVVSVSCTSQTISLLAASPADGWRVKIENRGPERIKLEFTSGERETKVGGTCVGGVPQQSTTDHD